MITHYGLFWSERDVFWGRPGKLGQLLGREEQQREQRGAPSKTEREESQKDFREYVGLYCLYGDNKLLYIGETGLGTDSNLFGRLKQHRKGMMAGRWDRFSWFGRETCTGQASIENALKQLEAVTIAIINPGFNKQAGAFGATQVFQIPHEKSEGDLETKLSRIAKQIDELRERKQFIFCKPLYLEQVMARLLPSRSLCWRPRSNW